MKKHLKIVSLLLLLALAVSVLAVSAFAQTGEVEAKRTTNLVPNGAGKTSAAYDGSDKIWYLTASSSDMDNLSGRNINGIQLFEFANFADDGASTFVDVDKKTDASGNAYAQIRRPDTSPWTNSMSRAPYIGLFLGDTTKGSNWRHAYSYNCDTETLKYGMYNHDFVTMDFDISSDAYLTEDGLLTDENTGKLAYAEGMTLQLFARMATPSSTAQVQDGYKSKLTVTFVDGVWYLKHDASGKTYPLSNEVGVWNHITYVIAIDNSKNGDGTYNFSNTKIYIYVDGNYFVTCEGVIKTDADNPANYKDGKVESLGLDQVRINFITSNTGTEFNAPTAFSYGVDNYSINYYAKDYDGELAGIKDDPTKPIYSYSDVVFSKDYIYQTPNAPAATVEHTDGSKQSFFFVDAAVNALTENATLTLNRNVENLKPTVNTFQIDTQENKYTFTLSGESFYTVSENALVEGLYSVRKPDASELCQVFFYDKDGSELLFEGTFALGNVPVYGGEAIPITAVPGSETSYLVHTGWVLEDGVTPMGAVTQADIDNGGLVVYASFDTLEFKYILKDIDGNLITPAGGYSVYLDAATFADSMANAPSGATVILGSDIEMGDKNVNIVADKTISLDLNGYRFSKTCTGSQWDLQSSAFVLNKNTVFNLYSSREGGTIFSSMWDKGGSVQGAAIFQTVSGINGQNITLNVGKAANSDYSGDNLSFYGGIFLEASGVSNNWKPDQGYTTPEPEEFKDVVLNIDGGTFVRSLQTSYAMFAMRTYAIVNIKNANLCSPKSGIFSTDARRWSQVDFIVENTNIIAPTGRVIAELYEGSTATFTGCTIVSDMGITGGKYSDNKTHDPKSNKGVVTFGLGTKIMEGSEMPINYKVADGASLISLAEQITPNWRYNEFKYVDQIFDPSSFEVKINNETYAIGTQVIDETSGLATIEYLDSDGVTVIHTGKVVAGSTELTYVPDNITPMAIEGNPYIGLGFTKWDLTGITIEAGGTYQVKPIMETPTVNVTGFKMNVGTYNKFVRQVYIPYDEAKLAELGITDFTISENGNAIADRYISDVTIDGKAYKRVIDYPSPNHVDDRVLRISFTYEGKEIFSNYRFSLPEYFTLVLEDEGQSDIAKKLIIEAVRYCNEVISATTNKTYAEYDALIAEYGSYLSDMYSEDMNAMIDADAARMDIAALSAYIESCQVKLDGAVPVFAFKVADAAASGAEVSYSYKNLFTGEDFNSKLNAYEGNMYYNSYNSVLIYFFRNDFTVKYTNGDTVVTGVYNLGSYISAMEANSESLTAEQQQLVKVARAAYAYSVAAYNYKTTAD